MCFGTKWPTKFFDSPDYIALMNFDFNRKVNHSPNISILHPGKYESVENSFPSSAYQQHNPGKENVKNRFSLGIPFQHGSHFAFTHLKPVSVSNLDTIGVLLKVMFQSVFPLMELFTVVPGGDGRALGDINYHVKYSLSMPTLQHLISKLSCYPSSSN